MEDGPLEPDPRNSLFQGNPIGTPIANKNIGATRSGKRYPSHGACFSQFGTSKADKELTIIINNNASPRKWSREDNLPLSSLFPILQKFYRLITELPPLGCLLHSAKQLRDSLEKSRRLREENQALKGRLSRAGSGAGQAQGGERKAQGPGQGRSAPFVKPVRRGGKRPGCRPAHSPSIDLYPSRWMKRRECSLRTWCDERSQEAIGPGRGQRSTRIDGRTCHLSS